MSYRREDTAPYARLLQHELINRIPASHVFIDLDSIDPGSDFAEAIRKAVDACAVLVALIGRQWVTLVDEEGHRRIDSPDDLVRFEIRAALERGVRVIPVLVDGAKPLQQQQLPFDLRKLARLNALELTYGRYEYDADQLLSLVQRALTESDTGTQHQSPPVADAEALAVPRHGILDGKTPSETAQKNAISVRNDTDSAGRLVSDAIFIAQSITDKSSKARALADIATALAATDPAHAAQLIADAESIALSITTERPAGELTKASALANIARALAPTDPARAAQLITDAESIAHPIADTSSKAQALADIATALAATDPDRAVRTAWSINAESYKDLALTGIATALAPTDPDLAARIAQSITYKFSKAHTLADIATALAPTDPDRAIRIAQVISEEIPRERALTGIATGLALTDPDRAVGVAQMISREGPRAYALTDIAAALAPTDPDRSERIAQSITDRSSKPYALAHIAAALAPTDPDRASRLITDAVRIAQSITDKFSKPYALAHTAAALAASDPEHAVRIAQSITDESLKWGASSLPDCGPPVGSIRKGWV